MWHTYYVRLKRCLFEILYIYKHCLCQIFNKTEFMKDFEGDEGWNLEGSGKKKAPGTYIS